MARGKPSTSARPNRTTDETDADRLQEAVDKLAENVSVLTDIIDQIREDLSWLTRNGMPHQPLDVFVHRMPRLSDDEPERGSFEFSFLTPPVRDPTAETLSDNRLRDTVVGQIVERLAEPLGHVAQEQLNALLSVLNDSHRKMLEVIRNPPPRPPASRTKKTSTKPSVPNPPAEPPPPRGRLF
jgi:hypothetical protein